MGRNVHYELHNRNTRDKEHDYTQQRR